MHIRTEQAAHLFGMTMASVSKDPVSWEKWSCVHITIEPVEGYQREISPKAYLLSYLGCELGEMEGVAFLCDDKQLLMLCRDISRQQLRVHVQDMLDKARAQQGIASRYAIYDVMDEWPSLVRICEEIGGNIEIGKLPKSSEKSEHFSEVQDLEYILKHHIRQRRYRDKIQIMIVEDDPVTCRIVSNLLREEYEVVLAETAEEAVLHYILHAPDLVFLDLGLPDHNGLEVAKAVIQQDPEAYVVMLTGNREMDRISESMMIGAKGYIEKPFRRERLFHYIHDCSLKQRQHKLQAPPLH